MADFFGSSIDETITGSTGDDQIFGGGGSDSLFGDDGNDYIYSYDYDREGADVVIDGGDGDDTIQVYAESDYYYDYVYDPYTYYSERVLVINDLATASVAGGDGNDDIEVRVWTGSAEIDGGEGDDTIRAYADQGGLTLTGGIGNDSFEVTYYGSLVDTGIIVTDFVAGAAGEVFDLSGLLNALDSVGFGGGNPFGTGHYELVQVGADVQLVGHTDPGGAYDESFVQLTFLNSTAGDFVGANFEPAIEPDGSPIAGETVLGTTGADYLQGGFGGDVIKGFGGDDDIYAGNGGDSIYAGSGNDYVYAESGNDSVSGAAGDDQINVGRGDDTVNGGAGNDVIYGGTGSNSLFGGAGNDALYSYGYDEQGSDVVVGGGDGDDTIRVQTESEVSFTYNYDYYGYGSTETVIENLATVTIYGDDGNDEIYARARDGEAFIDGGDGDDTIEVYAEQGATVTGGSGQDTFEFGYLLSYGDNAIEITDFETGPGGDVLDMETVLQAVQNGTSYSDGNPFGTGHLALVQVGADVELVLVEDPGGYYGNTYVLVTFRNTTAGAFDGNNFSGGINPDGSPIPGEIILGTNGRDFLYGGLGGDTIKGFDKADELSGGAGGDSLYAGGGRDFVYGGGGDDSIAGAAGRDDIYGGTGNDTINGGTGNDNLFGGGQSDDIFGGSGNDAIYSYDYSYDSYGADVLIDGGDGDDTIRVNARSEVSYSYSYGYYYYGYETVIVDMAEAVVNGGDGNDDIQVTVNNGIAVIDGGDGDDRIEVRADEGLTVTGGTGSDTIGIAWNGDADASAEVTDFESGAGGDVLDMARIIEQLSFSTSYLGDNPFGSGHLELVQDGADTNIVVNTYPGESYSDAIVVITLRNVTAGDLVVDNFSPAIAPDGTPIPGETVLGSSGSDYLYGTVGGDLMKGFGGSDEIEGGGGADVIFAGSGADTVYAGDGNDSIVGAGGADQLYGGTGDDDISGGAAGDMIYGGGGSDTINAGAGNDDVNVYNYGYDSEGADVVVDGGDGDDMIRVYGQSDATYAYDYYSYSYYTVINDLAEATVNGGDGNDTIEVSIFNGAAQIDAGDGDDVIIAGASEGLTLTGGTGADFFSLSDVDIYDDNAILITDFETGVGGDVLDFEGAAGALTEATTFTDGNPFDTGHMELLQDGTDVVLMINTDPDAGSPTNDSHIIVTFANTTKDDFVASNFDPAVDPDGSPVPGITILGTTDYDELNGSFGGDTIKGFSGTDYLFGYGGDDELFGGSESDDLYGGFGDDTIAGGGGADQIFGGDGDDTISGNGGGDEIFGGLGVDVMTGNGGNDRFVFDINTTGTGTGARDVITDFTLGDKINLQYISSFFSFNGTTADADAVWYSTDGTDTILMMDLDGDANSDMEIELLGVTSVIADDFIL